MMMGLAQVQLFTHWTAKGMLGARLSLVLSSSGYPIIPFAVTHTKLKLTGGYWANDMACE
eukprot:m.128236 g.128236  ORF g.128236 m.128236 type:complete len:60 (+) comp13868_c0_seq1:638-817(+)